MSTKDIDHGWAKIQAQIKKGDGAHVVVGVPKTTGPRDGSDPATMAEIAFWNEFGTESKLGNVATPERSYLRSTTDENRNKYFEYDKRLMSGVFLGKSNMNRALGLLGEKAKADVQAKIRSDIKPENHPYTIEMKRGSTGTLRDTGQLIQSITYEIRGLKK